MTLARISNKRINRSSAPPKIPQADRKPWYDLFIDYGFSSKSVPETDPPMNREYGEIFDWVIGNRWPIEMDEELILDIWLGYVDPWNYVKPDNTPVKTETTKEPETSKSPKTKPEFDTKNLDLLGGMKF